MLWPPAVARDGALACLESPASEVGGLRPSFMGHGIDPSGAPFRREAEAGLPAAPSCAKAPGAWRPKEAGRRRGSIWAAAYRRLPKHGPASTHAA